MTIFSLIKSVLTEYDVDVNKVYWQAYDEAANFVWKKEWSTNNFTYKFMPKFEIYTLS